MHPRNVLTRGGWGNRPATPCTDQAERIRRNPDVDGEEPQCDAEGLFIARQCQRRPEGEQCWCVTKEGHEIPGTRMHHGSGHQTEHDCLVIAILPPPSPPPPPPSPLPPLPDSCAYSPFTNHRPCANGGRCAKWLDGIATCICQQGNFGGDFCDEEDAINDCSHNRATNAPHPPVVCVRRTTLLDCLVTIIVVVVIA